MTRTTARLSVTAAAAAAPLLLLPWAAGSAQAHGAPTDPVSRVYACSPEAVTPTGRRPAGRRSRRTALRSPRGTTCAWRA